MYQSDKPLQIAIRYKQGWKLRRYGWSPGQPPKEVSWVPGSVRDLFGSHLVPPQATGDVWLYEGETDAMCGYQSGLPGYHLALGGQPTPEQWEEWLAYVRGIAGGGHTLHCCFDNDAPGEAYTSTVERLYRGEAETVRLPTGVKDVCDLYMQGHTLDGCDWEALPRMPGTLLTGDALLRHMSGAIDNTFDGLSTGSPRLDRLVGGYRPGSFWVVAGGAKNGKSAFVEWMTVQAIKLHGMRVMYIPLELTVAETMERLGACYVGKSFTRCPPETLRQAYTELSGSLLMEVNFGEFSRTVLEARLDLAAQMGVQLVVLDHITAACTSVDEGLTANALDAFAYSIKAKLNEHGLSAIVVTHINGADSDRATASNLRGSRGLAQVPTCVFGVMAVDDGVTEVYMVTRDRRQGIKSGKVQYDFENGQFTEHGKPVEDML